MLERVQRKGNHLTLFLGMQTSIATMENRVEIPLKKTGNRTAMEKATATHASTLAWKIPWMEEPGRLQSMGSRRVRHN